MPEGCWIMGAEKQLRYFSDGYVYLPKMKGIPSDNPQPPSPGREFPRVSGVIQTDSGEPIRGEQTIYIVEATKPGSYHFLIEPAINGGYRLTPKVF